MPLHSVSPLSILVADDEGAIRDLLTEYLGRAGHRVTCAASGEEARRLLLGMTFDVVITDIVMPDGDGFELMASVRQQQPRARILAISGGGKYIQGADCLKMARGLGAHGMVMKPFNWEELRAALATVVLERVSVAS